MITLHKFLNLMDLDSQLEIFNNETYEKILDGCRHTINLPDCLYDSKIVYFIPGIVTKIFINI